MAKGKTVIVPFKKWETIVSGKIKELNKVVKDRYGKSLQVKIEYSLNSARSLGTHQKIGPIHVIKLNPALLNELKQAYVDEVVVHEFCHGCVTEFVGYFRNGKRVMPHGPEFKQFCRMFGIVGKSTTNIAKNSKAMKKSGRNVSRYPYVCDCMEHQLTTIRHNKIKRGDATYTCKRCGAKLRYKKTIKNGKKIAA